MIKESKQKIQNYCKIMLKKMETFQNDVNNKITLTKQYKQHLLAFVEQINSEINKFKQWQAILEEAKRQMQIKNNKSQKKQRQKQRRQFIKDGLKKIQNEIKNQPIKNKQKNNLAIYKKGGFCHLKAFANMYHFKKQTDILKFLQPIDCKDEDIKKSMLTLINQSVTHKIHVFDTSYSKIVMFFIASTKVIIKYYEQCTTYDKQKLGQIKKILQPTYDVIKYKPKLFNLKDFTTALNTVKEFKFYQIEIQAKQVENQFKRGITDFRPNFVHAIIKKNQELFTHFKQDNIYIADAIRIIYEIMRKMPQSYKFMNLIKLNLLEYSKLSQNQSIGSKIQNQNSSIDEQNNFYEDKSDFSVINCDFQDSQIHDLSLPYSLHSEASQSNKELQQKKFKQNPLQRKDSSKKHQTNKKKKIVKQGKLNKKQQKVQLFHRINTIIKQVKQNNQLDLYNDYDNQKSFIYNGCSDNLHNQPRRNNEEKHYIGQNQLDDSDCYLNYKKKHSNINDCFSPQPGKQINNDIGYNCLNHCNSSNELPSFQIFYKDESHNQFISSQDDNQQQQKNSMKEKEQSQGWMDEFQD